MIDKDIQNKTTVRIDTSQSDHVVITLVIKGRKYEAEEAMTRVKTQVVLPLLESLLEKQGLTFSDIEAIEVKTGPGSFTGLRVGVSIANTLSCILKIPVNGKKIGELVEPTYG